MFTKGQWTITEPLTFAPNCTVRFMAGAELNFSAGSYMVVPGQVYFPESKQAIFKGLERFGAGTEQWGGLLFSGASVNAQYAYVRDAVGFDYQGRYYAGGLNIDSDGSHSIYRSEFEHNDTAVTVQGGAIRLSESRFNDNKVGVKLVATTPTVLSSVFSRHQQAGLWLSATPKATVMRNVLSNNDEAVRFNDGAIANTYYNWFDNNISAMTLSTDAKPSLEGDVFSHNQKLLGLVKSAQLQAEQQGIYIVKGHGRILNGDKVQRNGEEKFEFQLPVKLFPPIDQTGLEQWLKTNFKDCAQCNRQIER